MSPFAEHAPSQLTAAVIGCGKMGLQHVKAIAALPMARLVGVADPAADVTELRRLLPPETQIFSDPLELVARLRPDVVHIVTPPGTHAALASAALRAGSHVYVEKPFTPTAAEAERVLGEARANGLQVCAGHQVLFEPASLAARDALATIGRLVHVESYFSFRTVRRSISPADQAKDILPHAVYPLVEQLRVGTGLTEEPIEMGAIDAGAGGEIRALLRLGDATGALVVTLAGRPIEQYQEIVGTNGRLRADHVTGALVRLVGPGAGVGILFTPFRRGVQTLKGATRAAFSVVTGRHSSYPGLPVLVERFYRSLVDGTPPPIASRSILDTVAICEQVGRAADQAQAHAEQARLAGAVPPAISADQRPVVVTGGTGLLGRRVAVELREAGHAVRVLCRRMPGHGRVPGVDYVACDLSAPLDGACLANASLVVHCAAETAGAKAAHERNSVGATRHVLEAAAKAQVPKVIHISSLAVLSGRGSRGAALTEASPLEEGDQRGPYVWGKAESERVAKRLAAELGVDLRIIRPGPLVDFADFHPPGRLGRELGPLFVAVGPRRSPLPLCDVGTAASVIRWFAEHFGEAPPVLNLVESPPPTRRDLARRLAAMRPDLSILWVPAFALRALSWPLQIAQRVVFHSANPVDVYAAFASERYRADLAAAIVTRAVAPPSTPPASPSPSLAASAPVTG